MLHEFLFKNRTALIDLCMAKVALRTAPTGSPSGLEYGVPIFLDQLIKTLQAEQAGQAEQAEQAAESKQSTQSIRISGASGGENSNRSEIGTAATFHGRELSRHGFTVEQVVREYGDLCQAVTELALKETVPIEVEEFKSLNRCLDNAIADAVSEFSYQHDASATGKGDQAFYKRLTVLADELRSHIKTATAAIVAIKAGTVGLSGATGAMLDLSLYSLRNCVDRSLVDLRITAGLPTQHQLISLADFIAEVKSYTTLQAQARKCKFTVADVDKELAVDADRDMLHAAVGHLLQNAFRYTRSNTEVSLEAYASGDRVLIDITDHCGGLPPGAAEKMLLPLTQNGADRPIQGLSICQRSVEANSGVLSVRDVPGSGCVFTLDLPRRLKS